MSVHRTFYSRPIVGQPATLIDASLIPPKVRLGGSNIFSAQCEAAMTMREVLRLFQHPVNPAVFAAWSLMVDDWSFIDGYHDGVYYTAAEWHRYCEQCWEKTSRDIVWC